MAVIGLLLNERYRLDAELGRGGMGVVYRAHDILLDRDVAVKVLHETGLDSKGRARLLHEARAAAQLNHPNIVAVHDAGETDGSPFIVMELVEGDTLYDKPPTEVGEILSCACQICAALEHAHGQGIIHRDLKPENVMSLPDGSAKIMDFGLAHTVASRLTTEGMVIGTVFYLAPEQASGQEIDHRVDLYALGVMLYELTTGQRPFTADDPVSVIGQHLHMPVTPPRKHNPEISAALDALIVQLMSKRPEDRPASAAEVRRILEQLQPPTFVASVQDDRIAIPAFLEEEVEGVVEGPVVVAREPELERLDAFLREALQSRGQVVFVTGEAGSGKTTLVTEFARRANQAHPDLLVAVGNCNAHTGIGDAYLPFREVLGMYTGDLESKWAAGAITREGGRRLWAALPLAVQALIHNGQDLLDILVAEQALIIRLESIGFAETELLARLRTLTERRRARSTELEQALIFEQYTRVLMALAAQDPLVMILDDLQWADAASLGLLYHLGRRIRGSRVLILAVYRPDEVALGRGGEPHPLNKVLAELKRYGGDIRVDLGRAQETEGRTFVDALLDTEPNRLGLEFREALYHLTSGHPLFTVELLRAMEDRGDLMLDRDGYHVATPRLDWTRLPARVEGVIEERFGRLKEEHQETLAVASVEGETFSVQVVSQVVGAEERDLVHTLSRELDKKHRLVRAEGSRDVGGRRLQSYRFRHNLFQRHLYHGLDAIEREILHGEVATALEMLYGSDAEEIAPQLAYHYRQAGNTEKARWYLAVAGHQARKRYANQEAIDYYSQALALTPEGDLAARYELLLARTRVYDLHGLREAQAADVPLLEALAEKLGDPIKQAEAALWHARYAERAGSSPESIAAAKRAVEWAREARDTEQEVKGYQAWGRGLTAMSDYGAARNRLSQALDLARAAGLSRRVADSLRNLAEAAFYSGDYPEARDYAEQALAIYREIGDRRGQGMTLNSLGMVAGITNDCVGARRYYELSLAIAREIGDRRGEVTLFSNLGYQAFCQGDYASAEGYYQQALAGFREVGARLGEAVTLSNIGLVAFAQGDHVGALHGYEPALAIAAEIGDQWLKGYVLTGLGNVLARLGRLDEAAQSLQQAFDLRQGLGQPHLEMESRAGLARVALARGDLAEAQRHVDHILCYLDCGMELSGTDAPFFIYLTCIHVLQASKHPRTGEVLENAYGLLQQRAADIPDEATRRSFLEKVPWHREIVRLGIDQRRQDR